jgi:hypothetical protein
MVVLGGAPEQAAALNAVALFRAGDYDDCWSIEDSTFVQLLDRNALAAVVRDDQPLPGPDDRTPQAVEETFRYQDALVKALRAPRPAFTYAAQSRFDYADIDDRPAQYRGQIVRLYGRPKRVRVLEAPQRLKDCCAPKLYEVWGQVNVGAIGRLVCLVTPFPPKGLRVGDEQPEGLEIALTGYFFKKLKLGKGEGVPGFAESSVPLLIGEVMSVPDKDTRAAVAAASVIALSPEGRGGQLLRPLLFQAGARADYWTIEDPERAPVLNPSYLAAVKDDTRLPVGFEETERKTGEKFAYTEAIVAVKSAGLERFQNSLDPDITFYNLHSEPMRYRGRVVKIDGILRRVRRHAPSLDEERNGIKDVYEVWLINSQFKHNNPACLLCTELPEGIKVTEEVKKTIPVSFLGYFFKRYHYQAEDEKKSKYQVPLVVGFLLHNPPKKSTDWTHGLLPFFFAFVAGTFLFVFVLTYIFRRADRRVRARIDAGAVPFTGTVESAPEPPPVPESGPTLEDERRI